MEVFQTNLIIDFFQQKYGHSRQVSFEDIQLVGVYDLTVIRLESNLPFLSEKSEDMYFMRECIKEGTDNAESKKTRSTLYVVCFYEVSVCLWVL